MIALRTISQDIGTTNGHSFVWLMSGRVSLDLFVTTRTPDFTFLGKPGQAYKKNRTVASIYREHVTASVSLCCHMFELGH